MTIVDLTTLAKGSVSPETLPFASVAEDILGADYTLSIVIIGNKKSNELNKNYRHKDKPTNVLSFLLSDTEGEIFLNSEQIDEEAVGYTHTPPEHMLYLFIHGCLHLKGLAHGSTMDAEEERLFEKYRHAAQS